jgi:hypothetical protein
MFCIPAQGVFLYALFVKKDVNGDSGFFWEKVSYYYTLAGCYGFDYIYSKIASPLRW